MYIYGFKNCFGSIKYGLRTIWPSKITKGWTFKTFKIICAKCKCERTIQSPGVCVDEYSISIPFLPKHIDEPDPIDKDEK